MLTKASGAGVPTLLPTAVFIDVDALAASLSAVDPRALGTLEREPELLIHGLRQGEIDELIQVDLGKSTRRQLVSLRSYGLATTSLSRAFGEAGFRHIIGAGQGDAAARDLRQGQTTMVMALDIFKGALEASEQTDFLIIAPSRDMGPVVAQLCETPHTVTLYDNTELTRLERVLAHRRLSERHVLRVFQSVEHASSTSIDAGEAHPMRKTERARIGDGITAAVKKAIGDSKSAIRLDILTRGVVDRVGQKLIEQSNWAGFGSLEALLAARLHAPLHISKTLPVCVFDRGRHSALSYSEAQPTAAKRDRAANTNASGEGRDFSLRHRTELAQRLFTTANIPPLPTETYRDLFDILALVLNGPKTGFTGIVDAVLARSDDFGTNMTADDVAFVLRQLVIHEYPMGQLAHTSDMLAARYRSAVEARADALELGLTSEERMALAAWLGAVGGPIVSPQNWPQNARPSTDGPARTLEVAPEAPGEAASETSREAPLEIASETTTERAREDGSGQDDGPAVSKIRELDAVRARSASATATTSTTARGNSNVRRPALVSTTPASVSTRPGANRETTPAVRHPAIAALSRPGVVGRATGPATALAATVEPAVAEPSLRSVPEAAVFCGEDQLSPSSSAAKISDGRAVQPEKASPPDISTWNKLDRVAVRPPARPTISFGPAAFSDHLGPDYLGDEHQLDAVGDESALATHANQPAIQHQEEAIGSDQQLTQDGVAQLDLSRETEAARLAAALVAGIDGDFADAPTDCLHETASGFKPLIPPAPPEGSPTRKIAALAPLTTATATSAKAQSAPIEAAQDMSAQDISAMNMAGEGRVVAIDPTMRDPQKLAATTADTLRTLQNIRAEAAAAAKARAAQTVQAVAPAPPRAPQAPDQIRHREHSPEEQGTDGVPDVVMEDSWERIEEILKILQNSNGERDKGAKL